MTEEQIEEILGKRFVYVYNPTLVQIVEYNDNRDGLIYLHMFKRSYRNVLKADTFLGKIDKRWYKRYLAKDYTISTPKYRLADNVNLVRFKQHPEVVYHESIDEWFESIGYDYKNKSVKQLDKILERC